MKAFYQLKRKREEPEQHQEDKQEEVPPVEVALAAAISDPTVPEFLQHLVKLFQGGRLSLGKVGGSFERTAKTRMQSVQYPAEWFDFNRSFILARGILSDDVAVLLEQTGIDFLKDKGLSVNLNKAGLPRSSKEGYSAKDPGVVYFIPLHSKHSLQEYQNSFVLLVLVLLRLFSWSL